MKKSISSYRALARMTMKGNYGVMLGASIVVIVITVVLNDILNFAALHTSSSMMKSLYTLLGAMVSIIIAAPLSVGEKGYFVKAISGDYKLKNIFAPFQSNLSNVIKVSFIMNLKLVLWTAVPWLVGMIIVCVIAAFSGGEYLVDAFAGVASSGDLEALAETGISVGVYLIIALVSLVCAIPGIIKSFEYSMIPYLLSEDSNIGTKEAFRQTKEMMKGNKFKLFKLNLSFIGWYLLGLIVFGVGVILVMPYVSSANAHFYIDAKNSLSAPKSEVVDM